MKYYDKNKHWLREGFNKKPSPCHLFVIGQARGKEIGKVIIWVGQEFSSGEIPIQVERKVRSGEEYETIRFQGIMEWALPSLRVLCYRKKILATNFSSPALCLLFSVSSELNEWKLKKLLKQNNTLKHLLPEPCFMDLRSQFWDWYSDGHKQ